MSKNWMRHFELLLVDDKGDGIKISELKVTFNIQVINRTVNCGGKSLIVSNQWDFYGLHESRTRIQAPF